MALEADVEEPEKSPVFSKNAAFIKNHHVCAFVCDSLRMAVTGIDAFELDQMLDLDLEVHLTIQPSPPRPSAPWLTPCPGWELWRPSSAL
jgi:flagellar motor component MotA